MKSTKRKKRTVLTLSAKHSIQHVIERVYRGYYYDTETDLYYLQSRYYNPEWGRFLNADDIIYLGANKSLIAFNLFAYCDNNPINKYDETEITITTFAKGVLNLGGEIETKFGNARCSAAGVVKNIVAYEEYNGMMFS